MTTFTQLHRQERPRGVHAFHWVSKDVEPIFCFDPKSGIHGIHEAARISASRTRNNDEWMPETDATDVGSFPLTSPGIWMMPMAMDE